MLRISLNSLPYDFTSIRDSLERIRQEKAPAFATYTPDFQLLYTLAGKYAGTTNFVIIGRGGSVSGFRAIYTALAKYHTTKRVHIIDTLDPDYLSYVRSRCKPDDTLVIIISKSGNTVEVIENMLCFEQYKKIVVTENEQGALMEMAKAKSLDVVQHPPIGGRFSAGTECAMLPASLIYIDVKSIVGGMEAVFRQCDPAQPIEKNPALQLAAAIYLAEEQGYTEVYAPVYSKPLAGTLELWTQLMHESVCKEGKGQTFLFMEAPECQHHTNQKFFDGPRRMLGLFTIIERPAHEQQITLGIGLTGLHINDLPLAVLDGEVLSAAQRHEYRGVQRAADEAGIPNATIKLDVLNPGTWGELAAFWMYVAVYSSWLRGVNPFDQPGVEASKRHAIEERKA